MQTIRHTPNNCTMRYDYNEYRGDDDPYTCHTVEMQTDLCIMHSRHFTRTNDMTTFDAVSIHMHDVEVENPEPKVSVRTRDDGCMYVAVDYGNSRVLFLPMPSATAIHAAIEAHNNSQEEA